MTKLHIPKAKKNDVLRNQLINKLNKGLTAKLTLISASAGFGKTAILSQWVENLKRPVAWLSLDSDHSDVSHFLVYLIAALKTIVPEIAIGISEALQSPQPPAPELVLTALINDIAKSEANAILVLDDYHLVDSAEVDKALLFLVDNLPGEMHLVLATREDPQLPLARYRVRRQLSELRAEDLRFTNEETSVFFKSVMGINLSEEDISLLESRTEGWVAGLQLAALSLQGHDDKKEFVKSFSGSHRFILDYLVEEVLGQQSEEIQSFLLQTSILNRFCGSLCDALFSDNKQSCQEILEMIEQANLFVISLDDDRKWFRYHHLFAELLHQRLELKTSINVPDLHKRASIWFEKEGQELEAFRHAIASDDIDRAERLLEGNGMPLLFRGEMTPVFTWLQSLPEHVLLSRPSLLVIYSLALTFLGKGADAESKLIIAESLIDGNQDLKGQIAAIRAMLAIPSNDIGQMLEQSQIANEHLHKDNLAVRTITKWTLGLAYQNLGDRASAIKAFKEVIPISQSSGNRMAEIAASSCLGQVMESQNMLFEAEKVYRRVVDKIGDPPWPSLCEAFLGLGRICYERNLLEKAILYGEMSLSLALQLENVDTPISCWLLLAKVKNATDEMNQARIFLNKAEEYLISHDFNYRMNDILDFKVLILMKEGNFSEAAHLVDNRELSENIARLNIWQGMYSQALKEVVNLLSKIEDKDLKRERLNLLVLQILALKGDGQTDLAGKKFLEILPVAESNGFVRVFLDEGEIMLRILSEILSTGLQSQYLNDLVEAFGENELPDRNRILPDPLSRRELEVLELITLGLSNREIGEKLFLALDTVKGHNRKIFSKLGVKSRTMAINKAKSIGLLKS